MQIGEIIIERKSKFLVLIVIVNVLFLGHCFTNTIHIPQDYNTIQEGIIAASEGDTVLVSAGIYGENIDFDGKNITVTSLYFTTQDTSYISETIIDGGRNGSVVTFENGEDSVAALCGFTITEGSNAYGGGIHCANSSPRLRNLFISNNNATYVGGGIYCDNASPILKNVIISINNGTSYGGGMYCRNGSCPNLENVTIQGNHSNHGGGICCLFDSSPSLEHVIISNNTATWYGGGIGCFYNSNIFLQYVTIVGNSAHDRGAGIYCYSASPTMVNSIVAYNSNNFGIWVSEGVPFITYSDFYENEIGNFFGCGGVIGVNCTTNANGDSCDFYNNIQQDPLFLDIVQSNYHLTWLEYPIPNETKSPCIDAGDPNSPLDPDGTIADMGALYFDQNVSSHEILPQPETNLSMYPNPINSSMNNSLVLFSLKKKGHVSLQLFNLKGQLISTLIDEDKVSGEYTLPFPRLDLSSGIYFLCMRSEDHEMYRKVILLR